MQKGSEIGSEKERIWLWNAFTVRNSYTPPFIYKVDFLLLLGLIANPKQPVTTKTRTKILGRVFLFENFLLQNLHVFIFVSFCVLEKHDRDLIKWHQYCI